MSKDRSCSCGRSKFVAFTEHSAFHKTPYLEVQSGKIQLFLAELKLSGFPVLEVLRRRLVEVVCTHFEAFVATSTDFGRKSVITHMIKTRIARPFKQRLCSILFAWCQYLEQKVERLFDVGAISFC